MRNSPTDLSIDRITALLSIFPYSGACCFFFSAMFIIRFSLPILLYKEEMVINYGYIRVSSIDLNQERQLIAMQELNLPRQNLYFDRQSGKDFNRPTTSECSEHESRELFCISRALIGREEMTKRSRISGIICPKNAELTSVYWICLCWIPGTEKA